MTPQAMITQARANDSVDGFIVEPGEWTLRPVSEPVVPIGGPAKVYTFFARDEDKLVKMRCWFGRRKKTALISFRSYA